MSISDQQLIETMRDIGGLLFRRLTNELTLHEQIELDNWLNQQDPASKQFFEDCADWEQVNAALATLYDFDEKAALADIQKKIQLATQPAAPVIEMTRSRQKFYWAAAAVVLVVAGTAAYFALNKKKPDIAQLPIEQRYKNDVAPGGDKAVLELADGRKIVLDNASNGELAKQGTTKVIKLDNGQLAYHTGRSETAPVSYNTISTPKGGQYQIVLPDGSKVWLNAASTLKFPTSFTGKERKIELNGEGYFDIAKNTSMPFKVAFNRSTTAEVTGHELLAIEVLGTEFDLMNYGEENGQKVTVINGSVKASSGNEQIVLQPNQQVTLDKKSYALNLIPDANIEEATAWKNGLFQFHDANIESLMRQAARWYDVEITYEGKIDQQFKGTIPRRVSLSTFLKILEATGFVHFRINGKQVIVSP